MKNYFLLKLALCQIFALWVVHVLLAHVPTRPAPIPHLRPNRTNYGPDQLMVGHHHHRSLIFDRQTKHDQWIDDPTIRRWCVVVLLSWLEIWPDHCIAVIRFGSGWAAKNFVKI